MNIRQHIRTILKEETEDSDLTKKGLDLTIKLAKSEYPFIIGWKYSSPEGRFSLYINIICDIEKTLEFFNSELKPFYENNLTYVLGETFAYPFSITKLSNELSREEQFKIYMEMQENIMDIYNIIPTNLKPTNPFDGFKDIHLENFEFE
jgi:hypothetical protein